MARTPVLVRDAAVADAARLCTMYSELLAKPGADPSGEAAEATAEAAVRRIAEDAGCRILVAELHGQVVGCAFLRTCLMSPLHSDRVLHLSHLHVEREFVRMGVGRALVDASVTWAEQQGIATMLASVAGTDREANRYLARLGMSQVAVLRGATTAALRARLPHEPSLLRATRGTSRRVDQVLASRRSQRRLKAPDVAV